MPQSIINIPSPITNPAAMAAAAHLIFSFFVGFMLVVLVAGG